MSQASFAKRQREKARQEKAAAKAERRAERQAAAEEADAPPPSSVDQGALLTALADLHARFEDGDIDFDDFTEAKAEITQHLQVD
jgi:hypothetical protein